MALIKCPECGGQVSDKASSCPHCGYPMSENTVNTTAVNDYAAHLCTINGVQVDLTDVVEQLLAPTPELIKGISIFRSITGCGVASAKDFCQQVMKTKSLPISINISDAKINIFTPKCPTCGSTSITKITSGTRLVDRLAFGALSPESKAQYRCNACGYMW